MLCDYLLPKVHFFCIIYVETIYLHIYILERNYMYKCHFCGFSSDSLDDFDEDFKNHKGFWCPDCDGFNQFDNKRAFKPGYRLFLETPFAINNSLHCISAPFRQMFPCFGTRRKIQTDRSYL